MGSPELPGIRAALVRLTTAAMYCEAALLSADLQDIRRDLEMAREAYSAALRIAWKTSLTEKDAGALDSKSALLEELISQLEARYRSLKPS